MTSEKKSLFVVMRHSCIPEDEGRDEYVTTYRDRASAERWIKEQTGYFGPGSYYIAVQELQK